MGRNKTSHRRRRRFTALDTGGDDDVAVRLATLAKSSHARHAERNKLHTQVSQGPAVLQALRNAEASSEIFLPGVPPGATPAALTAVVQGVLRPRFSPPPPARRAGGPPEVSEKSSVLRCEVRMNRNGRPGMAFLLLRSKALADYAVAMSPVHVLGRQVKVMPSNRPLAGVGASWQTRQEPGAVRFPIGLVQVGELKGDRFSYFWASSPFFDLALDSHVEISPVSRVIAVTLGRDQSLLAAAANGGAFTPVKAMLRIEIPIHSICTAAVAHHDRPADSRRAVYLRTVHPPHLFRGDIVSAATGRVGDDRQHIWDCEGGDQSEVRWTRTVDPTASRAFSRCSGIRVFLDAGEPFYNFFNELQSLCLSDKSRPVPRVVTSHREASVPRPASVFRVMAERHGVPFSVRYEVACMLSLGAVLPSDVGDEVFWETLASLTEKDALRTLDAMHMRADCEDGYTLLSPMLALAECMDVMNVSPRSEAARAGGGGAAGPAPPRRGNGPRGAAYGGDVDNDSVDGASDAGGDDADEYLMEVFRRQLTLGDGGTPPAAARPGPRRAAAAGRPPGGSPATARPSPDALRDESEPTHRPRAESHHAYIRRLMLTPTRTVACRAESDLLNRVLREFQPFKDRFLRVTFADEDGASIAFVASKDIYARIRQLLRDGVEVAGERFVFLAFSSSQLRDHGCWLYNEEPGLGGGERSGGGPPPTADDIRRWMGDFSMIRVPSKYAARMGQTFSSTVGTVLLEEVQFTNREDIWDANMTYCFSDGVGIMSSALAGYVSGKLRLRNAGLPSAFQVRFGGAKGMLSVWDEQLPKGREVVLRQSMVKFQSEHKALEIVGYSKRLPLYLNRQIILILGCLGVPAKSFEQLQGRLLEGLNRSMEGDGAEAALNLLYTSGFGGSDNRLKSLAPMVDAAKLFRAGLTCANCEHLYDIMLAFRKRTLGELVSRTRIPLSVDMGMCAVGILDEAGVLGAGCIFLQYTSPESGDLKVVKGPVAVGRSPCLHPGDIQPLRAVYHPALSHLVDVVVFPRVGRRPIPSMLAGGDLDGDLFAVIWEPSLLPTRPGYPAMDYVAPPPAVLDRDVRMDDIHDFFVSYIRNDRLGQIANAHGVWADKLKDGIRSPECLMLAALHSTAVDFAKSGVPAEFPRDLMTRNETGQYPDFMGKNAKVSYKSTNVLGKLYRACTGATTGARGVKSFKDIGSSKPVDDIVFSVQYDDEGLDVEAATLCGSWNSQITRLMDQFGVGTEGEVVSGQVTSFAAHHTQLRGRREHFALLMRLNRQTRELRSEYRDIFFETLGEAPGGRVSARTLQKGCAWYKACHAQAQLDRAAKRTPLLSFPWVVSDVLAKLISANL